jgi:molybdenum cofactor cytidylyltransferase
MTRICAVVLAAGTASRFREAAGDGGPATKLVAELDGKALVRHVAEAALASRAASTIVVTGHAAEAVRATLAGLPLGFANNPDYATGLASSLRRGIAAMPPDCDGALILLGDMPRVSPAVIDRLIAAFESDPAARAVAPTQGGRRGNPVLISRALFAEVEKLTGDTGARPLLMAAGAAVREVAFDDEAVAFDVDTPDGLKR